MDTKYNGWTNYATWRVNLEIFDGFDIDSYPQDAYDLSEALKDYVEEYLSETSQAGLALDYALAFISDVNWYEIAEHLINESEE
jgi:hypothetical protein